MGGRVGRSIAVLGLTVGLAIGCARTHRVDDAASVDPRDVGTTVRDVGPRPDAPRPRDAGHDAPRGCVPSCDDDLDCAISCPANPLGANCCDTASGRCFGATTVVCPVPSTLDAGPVRVCASSCSTDSQCASTCPANPLGANCCDPLAGVCYAAHTPVCPAPSDVDAGSCPATCASTAECITSCPPASSFFYCCSPTTATCVPTLVPCS